MSVVSWKQAVANALGQLGGRGHLRDICAAVERLGERELSPCYKKVIQNCLEDNGDLFYSVYGTDRRRGWWALAGAAADLTTDDAAYPEGYQALREHIILERDPRRAKAAKERFREANGRLFCEACGFRFDETYGEDFIEAHYLGAAHCLGEGDFLMLCSNCHCMVHRKRPKLSRKTLDQLFFVQLKL